MIGMADSFLSSLLSFIIKFFMWVLSFIASLVIYPIQAIIVTAFPGIGWALSEIMTFLTNSLFPMIGFIRTVFLGVTCCPPELWDALIGILIFRLAVAPSLRFIITVVNIWRFKNGNIKIG